MKRNKIFDEAYLKMPVEERMKRCKMLDLWTDIDALEPEELHDCYAGVMDAFRKRLCELWGMEYEDACWVGVDAIDGVLCIGDYYVNADDVVLLVGNQVSFDDFMPWYTQWIDTENKNICLREWLNGARPEIVNDGKN